MAQENNSTDLPFKQIPDYPEDYTSGNVLARMIEGLGYRYYWATEGLTPKDLAYKPSEDARDASHTIEHLYGLSEGILNASKNQPNMRPVDWSEMTFEDFRAGTLKNLKEASELMRGKTADEVAELSVVFQRGENKSEFAYWHMINGQISDALYHTGQIVSFRRSSGNPVNPGMNVFMGKTRE